MDVFDLLLAIVVATNQLHRDAIVEQELTLHLGILFRTPRSLGALRHADAVARFLRRRTGAKQKSDKRYSDYIAYSYYE